MRAFAIVVPDNKTSMAGFQELNDSYDKYGHNDGLQMHEAISVDKVEMIAAGNGLNWNYPWEGKVSDLKSGLIKSAYTTADPRKRISCFVSHWYLWQKCVKLNEMILILEHDSRFIKKFFQPVPRIDEFNIPQGLAGNSAYVIKPAGAKLMLELSQEYGMWPNDALMCYQLVPKLGVTRNFYTRIQGLRSTTTL